MSSIILKLETDRLLLQLNTDEDPRASFCSSLRVPYREQICYRGIDEAPFDSPVESLLFYTSPNPPSNYRILLKDSLIKIGIIGFFKWDMANKSGTIGFSLNQNYRNQGLMTEAARAFIDSWFKESWVSWIEGKCQPENKASEKVMIKSGMVFVKTVKEPLFKGSRLYALNVFGISRSAWLKLKRT